LFSLKLQQQKIIKNPAQFKMDLGRKSGGITANNPQNTLIIQIECENFLVPCNDFKKK
jgi:hypothetical protein